MDWWLAAWAVICDAIAADLLRPLDVLGMLDLRAPEWYADFLWKAAAPFVAASLHAQKSRRSGRR